VAAVVAVAIVKGVGGSPSAEPTVSTPATAAEATLEVTQRERDQEALVRQLGAASAALKGTGIAGVLYLADEDCHVSALALPGLEEVAPPGASACRFGIEQRKPLRFGIEQREALGAGGQIDVSAPRGTGLRSAMLVQLLALEGDRGLAIVRGERAGEPAQVLALVSSGRVRASLAFATPELSLVRLAARNGLVAVRDGVGVLHVVRIGRRRLDEMAFPPWTPPAPTDLVTVAWSPDEAWTAVATRRAVYLYRTEQPELGATGIPLAAADIDWRRGA
jgi:hypothetical protein